MHLDYFNSLFIKNNLIPYHKERIGGLIVEQERFIEGNRVQKVIKLNREGEQSVFFESVKMYDPDQLRNMIQKANLRILHEFGDYSGSNLEPESPRVIFIGNKE